MWLILASELIGPATLASPELVAPLLSAQLYYKRIRPSNRQMEEMQRQGWGNGESVHALLGPPLSLSPCVHPPNVSEPSPLGFSRKLYYTDVVG